MCVSGLIHRAVVDCATSDGGPMLQTGSRLQGLVSRRAELQGLDSLLPLQLPQPCKST
jgi:hypothetical protein